MPTFIPICIPASRRVARAGVLLAAFALAAALTACSSSSSSSKLAPADFAAGPGETAVAVVPPAPRPATRPAPDVNQPPTFTALDVAAVVGSPAPAALAANPTPSNQSLVLDSLVGQINGNPVYASKFFKETKLDAALAGMVTKFNNETRWKAEARESIRRALLDKIRDELVLAEARSSLTPEERKGLLFFLAKLRDELIAGSGGSEATVDESLRTTENKSLDEKVKEDLDVKLVQREIYQRVASKINVSWKDVQLEYDRRFDEFNPNPQAVFHMIIVPSRNQEAVDRFTADLASGVDFKTLAARPENIFNSGEAGLAERDFKRDAFTASEFFPGKERNDAARQLAVGQTSPIIRYQDRVAWIHLAEINTPPGKSLYDVQLTLEREVKERRYREEQLKYLEKLLNQGSYSDIKLMTDKLLAIATDRFLVSTRP